MGVTPRELGATRAGFLSSGSPVTGTRDFAVGPSRALQDAPPPTRLHWQPPAVTIKKAPESPRLRFSVRGLLAKVTCALSTEETRCWWVQNGQQQGQCGSEGPCRELLSSADAAPSGAAAGTAPRGVRIYLRTLSGLCWVFTTARAFLQLRKRGLPLCGAQAPHFGGCSCGGWALGMRASATAAPRLQSTASVAVAHGLSCSTASGTSPNQGIKPVSPVLAGTFFIADLPGKPLNLFESFSSPFYNNVNSTSS